VVAEAGAGWPGRGVLGVVVVVCEEEDLDFFFFFFFSCFFEEGRLDYIRLVGEGGIFRGKGTENSPPAIPKRA
jgi:hypothetical protein